MQHDLERRLVDTAVERGLRDRPADDEVVDLTQLETQLPREEVRDVYLETTGGRRKTGQVFGLGTATEPVIGPVSEPEAHPSHAEPPETRREVEELRAQIQHLTEVQRTQEEYIRSVEERHRAEMERHRAEMEELRQSVDRRIEGLFLVI